MSQKSFLSELFESAAIAWLTCIVIGATLLALSWMHLGASLVPRWVLYASAGLFAAGIFSGRAAKTYKGLVFGLLILVLTFLTLGFGDFMGGPGEVIANTMAQAYVKLTSVLKLAFPLLGGVVAFTFPLMLLADRRAQR